MPQATNNSATVRSIDDAIVLLTEIKCRSGLSTARKRAIEEVAENLQLARMEFLSGCVDQEQKHSLISDVTEAAYRLYRKLIRQELRFNRPTYFILDGKPIHGG